MAYAKTIDLSQFIKEMKKFTPELKKEAIKAVYKGALKSQEYLNKKTPVDTGVFLFRYS